MAGCLSVIAKLSYSSLHSHDITCSSTNLAVAEQLQECFSSRKPVLSPSIAHWHTTASEEYYNITLYPSTLLLAISSTIIAWSWADAFKDFPTG